MGQAAAKKMVIPSQLSEGIKIVDTVIDAMRGCDFEESTCFAVRLALDEALANAIRHGNGGDASKNVTVEFDVDEERISISIADEGPGFDPEEVPDPTLDENLERPCGRGVMLIKAYMTSVSYNEKGNCVTMVKRRDCKLPN